MSYIIIGFRVFIYFFHLFLFPASNNSHFPSLVNFITQTCLSYSFWPAFGNFSTKLTFLASKK